MELQSLGIIVVDDQDFDRELVCRLLAKLGVTRILTAVDGREALARIQGAPWPVDVAICDLNMPGMDGVRFVRYLAETRQCQAVVLMSSLADKLLSSVEDIARAHGLTVLGAVEKPLTLEALRDLLSQYKPDMSPATQSWPGITPADIQKGLGLGQFVAHYQPKVVLADRSLAGFEVLARWNHPQHGVLPPAAFIDLAEKSGQIDILTQHMIEQGMQQVKAWAAAGIDTSVAINLSMAYLGSVNVADEIIYIGERLGVSSARCTLEVTETVATAHLANALENLARLQMRGYGISIDDYGTGFSSMQQLLRIPFTELKIDQSFVTGAATRPNVRAMLESSLQLARSLHLRSVAEGIESAEDWALLKSLGCDVGQGFYIAHPMEAGAVPGWHAAWHDAGGSGEGSAGAVA